MAKLSYKVDCRRAGQAFFETIAAFDCEPAAMSYAFECATTNHNFKYRVTKGAKQLASNEHGPWPKKVLHA